MWRCPNCETLNNEENQCRACGEKRSSQAPVSRQDADGWSLDIPEPAGNIVEAQKSKKLLIAIMASTGVLVIIVVLLVSYFLFAKNDTAEELPETTTNTATATANTVEPEVYYVNKFSDSGIFVRSGPGKEYGKVLHIEKGDTSVRLKYLDEVIVGEDGYDWYHVETPTGDIGYVREDVVMED